MIDRSGSGVHDFNEVEVFLRDQAQLEQVIEKVIATVASHPIPAEDLESAKTQLIAESALGDNTLEKTFSYVDELDREMKQYEAADKAWKTTRIAADVLQCYETEASCAELASPRGSPEARVSIVMQEVLRDLRRVPCADCGGRFKPYQLDFDHRDPATKSFNVMTGRAMLMSTAKVLAEVAKCDVVCVNCHRIRTRRQHRARMSRTRRGTSKRLDEKRSMWRRQAALLDQLRDVPCADCGGRFPSCSMDFDHRNPADKVSRVPALIGRAGGPAHLGRGGEVRYRVCEPPSCSNGRRPW